MDAHPFDGDMVVFDLETLAVTRRATVYEVGAVRGRYRPESASFEVAAEGHWFLHGRDQQTREVNPDTMAWMHRTPGRFEALARAQAEGLAVPAFSAAFGAFFAGATVAWCRGTHFDMAILEDLFESCGGAAPWRYDTVLDLRTLGRILDYVGVPATPGEMPHDALADCKLELPRVAAALTWLREKRR